MSRMYVYLLADDFPPDEAINTFEIECTGHLTMDQFFYWQLKNIIDGSLNYYGSFHFTNETVKRMYAEIISKQLPPADADDRLIDLLKDAIAMNSGLYGECEVVS